MASGTLTEAFGVQSKAVGAGMARAVPLFQDNNVIVFILQNLQHATHDSEADEHIPRLLVC